ncbi:MAG: HEAT repeat domain-containing protein [Armatimonadota bacterium]|nr:HEAT repeat domain-containing protein [Armatimonadota bacterium]MDR7420921.1 HEAT repeat domain-containing protein [Armatimonadota bacterium]MDR7453660.1 HEAT repeat domain-containing protein [Armatimonadota bacterium]MDR7457131.1 HEAT repeat domain-containing protein [Armatimonadota bacterium]MDR7497128.1 HEAT repeat domain-containing protein [Armatimonadota bacterium]
MPEAAKADELQRYLRQLESHDVTVRSDAAHALGKLGDEAAVAALARALQDPDEYVRKSAVMALRRIAGPAAAEALRAALADRSEQVVLQATNGLRDMRDKGAVEALIRVLGRRERSLQLAAIEALVRIGPDAVGQLVLTFEDKNLRRKIGAQVMKILVDIGPRGIDALLEALTQDSQVIQVTALSVLGRVGDHRIVRPLVDLFLRDPRMQEAVVATLARLEERGVLDPEGAHGERDLQPPKMVIDAFANRPRAEIVEQLRAALENPMPKVRRFALRVLFALFGEGAFDQFIASLEDEDVEVKRLTIRILGKLRNKRVIEPLVALVTKEGGEHVEEAVWNTLKVLTDLREFEQLRARVAKERAGSRPSVREVKPRRDLSPDWWREQD